MDSLLEERNSRFLQLYRLCNISSKAVVDALLQYIFVHRRPADILTDGGTQCISEVFSKINNTVGLRLPHSNAISERINAAVNSSVKSFPQRGQPLNEAVWMHQSLYNVTPHDTKGYFPNIIILATSCLILLLSTKLYDFVQFLLITIKIHHLLICIVF